jgi:hypothetical protein
LNFLDFFDIFYDFCVFFIRGAGTHPVGTSPIVEIFLQEHPAPLPQPLSQPQPLPQPQPEDAAVAVAVAEQPAVAVAVAPTVAVAHRYPPDSIILGTGPNSQFPELPGDEFDSISDSERVCATFLVFFAVFFAFFSMFFHAFLFFFFFFFFFFFVLVFFFFFFFFFKVSSCDFF